MATQAALTQLAFTPQHAAMGGLILGIATVANLVLNGRVLGISGAMKGLIQGDRNAWRFAFLAGMLLASPFLAGLMPGAFEVIPSSFTMGRAVLGGVLVGLGASLGKGCTSGHGICGNARLSVRSMVYTLTFMAVGAATAYAAQSAAVLGLAPIPPAYTPMTADEANIALRLLVGGVAALASVGVAWRLAENTSSGGSKAGNSELLAVRNTLGVVASGLVGAVFSAGLVVSGMVRPSKVAAFLSVTHPAWDASLMFVMMAAIGVSIIPYQLVMGRLPTPSALKRPELADAYTLPPPTGQVDSKLLLGGVLFGAGWGLTGMCPGPALVAAVTPAAGPAVWAYLTGLLGGMVLEPGLSKLVSSPGKATA